MNYAPRLSFPYKDIAPWVSRVAMVSEKVIFYEHSDNPDNIHCHGLIYGLSVDKDTIKNWLKETLRLTPTRTQWTFPEQYKGRSVNDDFISYMSKGKLDPVWNKGFAPELVAEQKAKGYDGKAMKGSKRVNAASLYYDDFVKWLYDKDEHKEVLDLTNPYTIKNSAWRYMMIHTPMPMSHQRQLYVASVIRYCWDYDISLPDDLKKSFKLI